MQRRDRHFWRSVFSVFIFASFVRGRRALCGRGSRMSGKDLPLISFQPRREIIFKGSNDVAPGGVFKGEVPVPKIKTHKGAKKRFHITASGKIKRGHSHARHILTKKSSKRKRKLDQSAEVSPADRAKVRTMLPYA